MNTEKKVVVKEVKNGKLEDKMVYNAEMGSLIAEIFMDFEPKQWLFGENENLTKKFIRYLFLLGLGDRDTIYSLFEDNAHMGFKYSHCLFEKDKFKEFPRIFFWDICNHNMARGRVSYDSKNIDETNKYIQKITKYILENEMDLLVAEIKEYIEKYRKELDSDNLLLNSTERKHPERRYYDLAPDDYYSSEESEPYKFYPPELLERIKEMIPERHRWHFEYGQPGKSISEINKECEESKETAKEKIIEATLPEGILSNEMSDNEIIEKMREYEAIFLDKAMEEKNECVYDFVMRKIGIPLWSGETEEEFINYVLNVEIKKFGNGTRDIGFHRFLNKELEDDKVIWNGIYTQKSHFYEEEFQNKVKKIFFRREDLIEQILQVPLREYCTRDLENISKKINLLIVIGTKKAFFKIWEVLGTRKSDSDLYRNTINKWGEHFPLKLLKTEVEKGNNACIWGVMHSENKYAVIALFAFLVNKNYYDIKTHSNYIGFNSKDEKNLHEKYYRYLVVLFTNSSEDVFHCHLSGFDFIDGRLGKIILRDILDIISSQLEFGRRILNKLEKDYRFNYYFRHELTSEQIDEIEELEKLSYKCNQSENECGKKISEIWGFGKGPLVLRQRSGYIEYDQMRIAKIKNWLYEHKKLDLKNNCNRFCEAEYKDLRNITLERPFFFPKDTDENTQIMTDYFFRELIFSDFIYSQGEEKHGYKWYDEWTHYWQKLIEKAHKDFKQVYLEKPSLPIIDGLDEYLLSRTDGMLFFSAIEGLIHCHYRAFLTGCRKLQIEKLLKKGTLRQEEADRLIAMAENPDTDYYAWSDEEIKNCLSPETDLEKLHAELEPEFMVKIFDKSILWVIEHRDSELWQTAPWFGMQIFNKSYVDRPSIWAKHLIKIADGWTGSENMLIRICFALGHLREALDGGVPIILQKIADRQKNCHAQRLILIQRNLFNRKNFNMGHHRNPLRRVELCKEELIKGQNREVNMEK